MINGRVSELGPKAWLIFSSLWIIWILALLASAHSTPSRCVAPDIACVARELQSQGLVVTPSVPIGPRCYIVLYDEPPVAGRCRIEISNDRTEGTIEFRGRSISVASRDGTIEAWEYYPAASNGAVSAATWLGSLHRVPSSRYDVCLRSERNLICWKWA